MKLIDDPDSISEYEQHHTKFEEIFIQTCEDSYFSPFMPVLKENLVSQLLAYTFYNVLLTDYMFLLDNFLTCMVLRGRTLFC